MNTKRTGWQVAWACGLLCGMAFAAPRPMSQVRLNGVLTDVRWSDGDSFRFRSGEYNNLGTRLVGYNTLESYGPVHSWGDWTPVELFEISKSSASVAASATWNCTTTGKRDGYQRVLVNCPDLAEEMVRQGHAFAYVVEEEKANERVLAAQAEAQKARRGIWKKGVVWGVLTSVHSMDEVGSRGAAYNRVVDTRTGRAEKVAHRQTYPTCQTVCIEVDGTRSCMVYVPFENRYRHKPDCIRASQKRGGRKRNRKSPG